MTAPPAGSERRTLVQTSLAHALTHLFMLVFPTIAVFMAPQWGLGLADLLLLSTPGFLLYGVAAIPVGLWADRVGGWLPMTLGVLGMGAGMLVCGAAREAWHLAAGLGVVGLFGSAYHPAGIGLITHGTERTARALGLNGAFGSGAVALAPGLAEVLCRGLGWRWAFLTLALPAVVFGAAAFFFPIRVAPSREPEPASPAEGRRLLSPTFGVLCVAIVLTGVAYRGNSVIFPTLFQERVPFIGPGIATSATYGLAIVMNIVGGHLAERFGAPRIYLAFHALSLPPLIFTAWLSGIPLLLVAALYAGCALGMQPAENAFIAQLTPSANRSVAYGIKFTLNFGVGALAVPLVAWILGQGGTRAVQLTLSGVVAALVLVAAGLVLRRGSKAAGRRVLPDKES